MNDWFFLSLSSRVETDILFGNRQGATTLLVFSGATSETYLESLKQGVEKKTTERDILPSFCVKNVAEFLQYLQWNDNEKKFSSDSILYLANWF